jgi:hypothetical protein
VHAVVRRADIAVGQRPRRCHASDRGTAASMKIDA